MELNRDSEILSCRDAEREKGNGGVMEWGEMERWNGGELTTDDTEAPKGAN